MYELLTGPLLWLTFIISFGGLAWRVREYIKGLDWKLDRVAYHTQSTYGWRGAKRSIIAWLTPFGTANWKERPLFTILFFSFHIGLLFTPVFLEAHNIMLKEYIGFGLPAFGQGFADFLTWVVVVGGVFMVLRRIAFPEVRILTTWYDIVLILITVAPFATGLICRYDAGNYNFWLITHILSGHVFLLSLPFTKLNHAVLFFMSRGQLGMDYGIKRGGMKGSDFAW
jgi:nitrate reductase gamma subunit